MGDAKHTDTILDYAAMIVNTERKSDRRDRNFENLGADEVGCEVCGRVVDPSRGLHYHGHPLGPTCAKKLVKLGLEGISGL